MRVFYVIYLEDGLLLDCIEAIRLLSNPMEKVPAHITVRGPYSTKINTSRMNEVLVGNSVTIDRTGNFFEDGQNTVFFGCTSPVLEKVWFKRDFPFSPHVTLYDRESTEFARRLYEVVSGYKYYFSLKADKLHPLESRKGQASFRLQMWSSLTRLSTLLGEDLRSSDVPHISLESRLKWINKLCKHLSAESGPRQLSMEGAFTL
jgi:hypothetical protein